MTIATRAMVFLLVLILITPIFIDARQGPAAPPSQNELIERRVLPQLEFLFQKLIDEKLVYMNGVELKGNVLSRVEGTRIRFGSGDVTELNVEGLQTCDASAVEPGSIYRAPHGAMKTVVPCHSENVKLDKPFMISWTLKYRPS